MARYMHFWRLCQALSRNWSCGAINCWNNSIRNAFKWNAAAVSRIGFSSINKKIINIDRNFTFSMLPYVLAVSFLQSNVDQQLENNHSHDKEIIDLIKQGKRLLEKGEHFGKAEMLYLRALHLAIEDKNLVSVAYVQDLLANLALANNQLEKSEVLFRKVLQNLISNGKAQNDPAIIEISLKLASIYARMGKKELALNGYEWSADICRTNIKEIKKKKIKLPNEELANAKALLGMILDSHGRYLHDEQDNKAALAVTLEALGLCKELFGEKDIRTLVLYNDLSSIKLELGDYDGALDFVQKALKLSEAIPGLASPYDKAVFYANLSYIYVKQGKVKDAKKYYMKAMTEASKTNDEQLKAHVTSLYQVFPTKEEK